MRIAQITASVSHAGGGVSLAVGELATALHLQGATVRIDGIEDEGVALVLSAGLEVRAHPLDRTLPLRSSVAMERSLAAAEISLYHLHGLWTSPSRFLPRLSAESGAPLMISPHGMLDAWALANSRWKKRLAALWFENVNLRKAACLHALCGAERDSIRAYGLTNPIAIIPNGVDLPERSSDLRSPPSGLHTLLFLGRLHPKKGLVNALRGWKQATDHRSEVGGREEWRFVIAGWDQGGHEAELKRLCDDLGLSWSDIPASEWPGENLAEPSRFDPIDTSRRGTTAMLQPTSAHRPPASVIFTGPAFGESKSRLLRLASAFILPSFSEGLPMAVLEAWAHELPVLMTDHCNLPEGFSTQSAIRIGTDPESIAEGLRLLFLSPTSDLRVLGTNGRALVEERFTWQQVSSQMVEVYAWILGRGPKPTCVEF